MVGSDDTVPIDDATGDNSSSLGVSSVSCSICLDLVTDDGERSTAKLQCGHEFHLDCIGSAFNMKGAMQCPNCRQIEKGRWLYANGSARSFPDIAMDDWTPNEDSYELSYPEMPFGLHWCPFSGLTRVDSSFEELESPSTTYHDLQGSHAIFAEHAAAPSLAHSYVAYLQPHPPASLNSSENLDDPNFSHRWNGLFGHNEIYTPFPANSIQHQGWGRHAPPLSANRSHMNSANQAAVPSATLRSARAESDSLTRSGSTVHPFLHSHGSIPRGGLPFVSSTVHPSNNPRSNERIHVSHATHHQQTGMPLSVIPGVRRFIGQRGPPLPAVSPSDHSRGFYICPPLGSSGRTPHEPESHPPRHVHHPREREHISHFPIISFDRDSVWGSTHHSTGGSNSSNRSGSLWQRHWS